MWRVRTAYDGSDRAELDRTVAALSTVQAPDGQRCRLRLLAPGEPERGEGPFATLSLVLYWLTRGLVQLVAPSTRWVVLVQRQRGPWRGFETLHSASFVELADAERHARQVRATIERGEPLPRMTHRGSPDDAEA